MSPASISRKMRQPKLRIGTVVRKVQLSPTMVRVTLGGDEFRDFQSDGFDDHVKMFFPDPKTGEVRLPKFDGGRPIMPENPTPNRQYTVRSFRLDPPEVDFDFVLHGAGIASAWADSAEEGDKLHVAGPRGSMIVANDYNYYLLVADESALPAVARFLEEAPEEAKGVAVIAVPSKESELALQAPSGFSITWVHTGPDSLNGLSDAARAVKIPEGSLFAWLAGETEAVRGLRKWVREDLRLTKDHSVIAGYWRRGKSDSHERFNN